MSNITLSANAGGSGIFTIASPSSNTNRTLTLPDNTGTLLSSASSFAATGPAFRAYGSALQSVSNLTWTKVNFNTEEFDTNSSYDPTTNYRFTPTVAGYYQLNANILAISSTAGGAFVAIYKNGSAYAACTQTNTASGTNIAVGVSTIAYANGSTDYFEVYMLNNNGPYNMGSNNTLQSFSGALVRGA